MLKICVNSCGLFPNLYITIQFSFKKRVTTEGDRILNIIFSIYEIVNFKQRKRA